MSSIILKENLFEEVLVRPAEKFDELCIVSGFATPAMGAHQLDVIKERFDRNDVHINLIVGMTPSPSGISKPHHKNFVKLAGEKDIFNCSYLKATAKPTHTKLYCWLKNGVPQEAFLSSANYTLNAFKRFQDEIYQIKILIPTVKKWVRKRAPSKLYYGDKQYIFTGLVRCGCCGSLMTCETKVKDDKHSYNYLKCNKLRSKCSQKPINEAKILQQLEQELSLPINISDTMLKNIKSEVKKQLKAENINTTNLKRDITIKLNELDEEAKNLFRGYMKGKCDEKMYNELKTEIEMEKEKLQKDMDKYLEIDAETDEILANIAEIAANVGKILKSPIISEKRDILKLILSDCKTEGKNIAFSIVKPFNELLKTPETDKWCRWQESDLRPRHYQ